MKLDLDAARLGDYDRETVIRLFREYEFRTLIDRLPALAGESPEATQAALREVRESGSIPAAQVAGRPEGWGPGRESARPPAASPSDRRPAWRGRRWSARAPGLQLAMDFDAVAGRGAGPATVRATERGRRRPAPRAVAPAAARRSARCASRRRSPTPA